MLNSKQKQKITKMKKRNLIFGIVLSMTIGVALNFMSINAFAEDIQNGDGGKITCHSSSTVSNQHTHTSCATCTVQSGLGSDAGQCRP